MGNILARELLQAGKAALERLVVYTPVLAVLGIAFCALAMIVTGQVNKWGSRAMMIFLIAAAIRVIW